MAPGSGVGSAEACARYVRMCVCAYVCMCVCACACAVRACSMLEGSWWSLTVPGLANRATVWDLYLCRARVVERSSHSHGDSLCGLGG